MMKSRAYYEGQIATLIYLLDVAQKTESAEVWRALFAEQLQTAQAAMAAVDRTASIPTSPRGETATNLRASQTIQPKPLEFKTPGVIE